MRTTGRILIAVLGGFGTLASAIFTGMLSEKGELRQLVRCFRR